MGDEPLGAQERLELDKMQQREEVLADLQKALEASAEDGGDIKFLSVKVGKGDRTRGDDGNMYETRRAPGTAPVVQSPTTSRWGWSPSASLDEQSLMRYDDSKGSLRSMGGRPAA